MESKKSNNPVELCEQDIEALIKSIVALQNEMSILKSGCADAFIAIHKFHLKTEEKIGEIQTRLNGKI